MVIIDSLLSSVARPLFYNCALSTVGLTSLFLWFKLDFLSSDVMLGEGNILAHLVILGYKVSYQQVGGSFYV